MSSAIRVAPLAAAAAEFRSGRPELDRWLAAHGVTATRSGSARVYLATEGPETVGYFALAAGSVDPVVAGTRMRRGMPRKPGTVELTC